MTAAWWEATFGTGTDTTPGWPGMTTARPGRPEAAGSTGTIGCCGATPGTSTGTGNVGCGAAGASLCGSIVRHMHLHLACAFLWVQRHCNHGHSSLFLRWEAFTSPCALHREQ